VDARGSTANYFAAGDVFASLSGDIVNEVTSGSLAFNDAERLRAGPAASWGAILAGATVAVSISFVLITLGLGLGFASISPWPGRGISAGSFTVAGAIWLIVTQWISAAIGGYIAGRLRHRWLATHTHEVFFRDTAHGLVTWAVCTLILATVLAGSVASVIGGGARAVEGVAGASSQTVSAMGARGPDAPIGRGDAYDLDKLFRSGEPGATQSAGEPQLRSNDSRMEAMHIAASVVTSGRISEEDRTYLVNLVTSKTGITAIEAQKRVDVFVQSVKDATAKAKAAADEARKSTATAAIYTALSLLIGAFIASVAAAIGGRLRDEHL
jgi:hypothetical protein